MPSVMISLMLSATSVSVAGCGGLLVERGAVGVAGFVFLAGLPAIPA
ncbi:hypothetical protein ACFQ16_05080 [Saccharopolyspora rosea]|uniref:Uncharacterized protein n=1 Tax=Saccharopolyspora rosea TaxID=524884 RepID=A0ABW3FKV6_9PSEU